MTTFAVTNEEDILPALNYVLSNLDLNGSGGNGNANIPANVLVANTTSGQITTYGGDKYGFFYQYINLRYGNSATGTGFSTVPTNANYFGTYNSSTQTPSANPTAYTWTEVAGGFGTTETIYYSAIGGRQVVWVAANSAPSSSFVVSVANVAIDLDVVTTAAGTPGSRGPVSMAYIVTTSDPNLATSATLTTWFSASPAGPAAPIGTGLTPVVGDIATFTWAAGAGAPNATNTFNGSIWVPAYAQRIDGNVVVAGTLAANALVANSITATQIATGSLTTNLFTANTINGNIITVATLNGNAITANTISGNTIIANSFAANTINGNSLIIGTVSNTQIANGTITTNQVAANTITANNIAIGANITGSQIAANTITAQNLVANTLTANTVVSTGATLGSYISQGFWLDGPTGTARFGNNLSIGNSVTIGDLITSGSLNADTVGTTQIQNLAVGSAELATSAVTSTKISSGAVTTGKIAAGAVTAGTIAAGAVTAGTVAANVITGNNIQASTITATNIVAETITANQIALATIETSRIAVSGVATVNIADSAVVAAKIQNNAVIAGKINANAVTTTTIAGGAITTGKIAAGTITATQISASYVYAGNIISTNATLGSTSSPGYWLRYTDGDARFGGNVSIGNNLTVGNLITSSALNSNVVSYTNMVLGTIPAPVGSVYISPNVTVGPGGTNYTQTTANWYDLVLGYTIIPFSPAYVSTGPTFTFTFNCNMALTASPSGPSFPYIQMYIKPQYSSGSTAPGATYTSVTSAQYFVSVSSFTGAVSYTVRATLAPSNWTSTTSCLVGVAFFASLNGSATSTFTNNNWNVS